MTARWLRSFTLLVLGFATGALVALPARLASAAEDEAAKDESAEDSQATDKASSDAEDADGDAKGQEKEAGADEKHEDAAAKEQRLGHAGQFGLRVGFVGGLSMIVRYEKSTFCKVPEDLANLDNEQKFCGHVSPFALDLGLSFALADSLEPFVWARLGLSGEEQTDTNPLVVVGAGVRLYTMSDSLVKVLIEPAIGLEFEDGQGHVPWSLVEDAYSTDIVFHAAAGPQFDFSRNVGLYLTGGITAGVIRSLHATLDLQLGLQGRLP